MPLQACVDASLVVRWLVPEEYTDEALALLDDWIRAQTELVAPTHLLYEVSATLRFLVYRKVIDEEIGFGAFARLRQLPLRLTSRTAIFPSAWSLARELNQPTTYDVSYLALARLLQCELWTADRKFYKAVRAQAAEVKWIGDYRIAPRAND